MREVQLTLKDVSKIYTMGEVNVHALRSVNLEIRAGEILIVLGQSGSGKSTLLNMIGGMDRPTSGSITTGKQDLTKASDRQLTLYRRRHIGFVFQFFNLIPTLTALENVQVAVEIAPKPLDALESLNIVGLGDRAQHFPSQLSGGQQQRVAIARALAANPQMLLCDEPTGNLDSETSQQILELLCDLNERLGKTVIMITHNSATSPLAHRVAEIRDGALVSLKENAEPKRPKDIEF